MLLFDELARLFRGFLGIPAGKMIEDDVTHKDEPKVTVRAPQVPAPDGTSAKPREYRQFRMTYYLIAEEPAGGGGVPIKDATGNVIARTAAGFFGHMALQGSGKLVGGVLLNVTGKYVKVTHEEYAEVLAYHKKYLAKRPYGYSGLIVENDKVTGALAFHQVPSDQLGLGYGKIRGVAHTPFRTAAVDMGLVKKSDPKFKGQGGVIPAHTKFYVKELAGVKLPDGTTHDGIVEAIDNGGGIFGAHFDLFVGTASLKAKVKLPSEVSVWFDGIEQRLSKGYDYGLHDIA